MKLNNILLSTLLASGLALGGCATVTTEDLAEVRALAEQAAADAAEAKALAAEANTTAQLAGEDAKAARAAAEAAVSKSEETETKIDRMFKKSMYK